MVAEDGDVGAEGVEELDHVGAFGDARCDGGGEDVAPEGLEDGTGGVGAFLGEEGREFGEAAEVAGGGRGGRRR